MRTEEPITRTRSHVLIGYMNPFLECSSCYSRVPYWHDPDRCGCDAEIYNSPCGHQAEVNSMCPTWNAISGCECVNKATHDKE